MELDILTKIIFVITIVLAPLLIYQERKDRKLIKLAYDKHGLRPSNSLEFFSNFRVSKFNILNKQGFMRINSRFFIANNFTFGVFAHASSEGGNSSTRQSVYAFKTKAKAPRFYIRPKTISDKLKFIAGYNDINLEDCPEFSDRYYLQSPEDPVQFKKYFKENYLNLFIGTNYLWLESNGDTVIFFFEGKFSWQPIQIEEAMSDFMEIKSLFDN